ncbi:DNA repair ATPase SMC5 [Aspergillus vadensis CBS 113365]|uniref:Structural maintenance of chromosomes protein 5 n=1 Tax=Aspergillus vadensis (strain CBS 113365 / IMI 142717 / IBT 24658) TaxID=1448311 RepID=A0A319C704_ASPVC|nr:P-loop containing nucleoside triphosphate hydrolase protein [Aspergillus vadensis CBS 113365]PYH71108.1 P-loop containing nucleoside triphosphate hydrolase protein [Aspergillus vadensis CBS 113365]
MSSRGSIPRRRRRSDDGDGDDVGSVSERASSGPMRGSRTSSHRSGDSKRLRLSTEEPDVEDEMVEVGDEVEGQDFGGRGSEELGEGSDDGQDIQDEELQEEVEDGPGNENLSDQEGSTTSQDEEREASEETADGNYESAKDGALDDSEAQAGAAEEVETLGNVPQEGNDEASEESESAEDDIEVNRPSKSISERSKKSSAKAATPKSATSRNGSQNGTAQKRSARESTDDDQDSDTAESESADRDTDEYAASNAAGSGSSKHPSTQTAGTESTLSQSGLLNGGPQEAYKPGAIVRIRVTDFVTYTSAEFFPGPKLNMVIGPNGTGKSTLVCAICLGLGWGPQHLGRAKDTGEFVKHGCREATIEIELAGKPGSRHNPVVSRTIKRDGNKSTFTINGKQASRSQVLKLAQSFSIQIDNLCQFLPQDKVAEFAALTPIELLNSTQRAAAGEEMIEWHENLKRLRAEQKKLQADNQGDRDTLTNLEDRQEMQRADVERMRQRAQIKRKIEMLEMARPVLQYKQGHERYNNMRREVKRIERELARLKEDLEPALRSVNAKQQYCLETDEVIKYKMRRLEEAERAASDAGRTIEEHEREIKGFDDEINAEKEGGQGYRQEATKIQQMINKLTRQLNEKPDDFDVEWYNEQIREKRREIREIEEKAAQIKSDRRPLFESLNVKADQIKQAERQLQNLESQAGQQENKLGRLSADSVRAYHWIQQNQDKFEKEVFGPPVVTCSIKDPKYADAVESFLQRTDFMAFTTQTRNDFRTLQRILCGEQKLTDVSIRTCSTPLDRLQPSAAEADEFREFGFECWAKDCISGPDPVLAMLCSEKGLHQIPISHADMADNDFERLKTGRLISWVSGRLNYTVMRRREYDAISSRLRPLRPARFWTSQPVDASERQRATQKIHTLKGEVQEVQEQINSEKARLEQLGHRHTELKQEQSELEREKGEKQTALTQFRAIPERIRQQEARQKENQKMFEQMRTRVANLRSEQDQASLRKAEAVIEYAKLHEEVIKLKVRHIEGVSDLEVLKARNVEHRQTLEAKHNELKEANQEIKDIGKTVKKLQDDAVKVANISQQQPDLAELLHTIKDMTMEQFEADIDSEKARLELTHGGNSNVIKEFEERGRQIDKLRDKLADFQKKLDDYNHAINEIRGRWEPKLDSIIKSISDAFSDSFARIGCAGQVTLDKAEETGPNGEPGDSDFDQWSIQIHVKFREHENLSLLDSHRQSGGERAVSTIFYLMALQSLSASPFRVVDEINQGMDPRNERMVHGRLVDIACAPSETGGGGQYFLITPKLLSGLAYKPGMRVLCIYSGEHMPEDYNLIDFKGAIAKRKAVTGRRTTMGPAASTGSVSVHG